MASILHGGIARILQYALAGDVQKISGGRAYPATWKDVQLYEPREGLERVCDAQLRAANRRKPDVGGGEKHVHVEARLPFNERLRRGWSSTMGVLHAGSPATAPDTPPAYIRYRQSQI